MAGAAAFDPEDPEPDDVEPEEPVVEELLPEEPEPLESVDPADVLAPLEPDVEDDSLEPEPDESFDADEDDEPFFVALLSVR